MKRFKRILLVWDGDTPVTSLFPWCRRLAEASSAEGVDGVWCREAVVPEYPGLELPEVPSDPNQGGEALLEAMNGIPTKLFVEAGDPLRAVLRHLAGGTYDLVLVSIHDEASRYLAERLARKSPVGVLALPPNASPPPSKVRLGVDFSDLSPLCLDWAEAFATLHPDGGAELEAVHVMEMPRVGRATMGVDPATLLAHVEKHAGDQLDEFLTEHSRAPERCARVLVNQQSAGETLMQRTEDPRKELIVVGCHGRNAFSIALLGSHACDLIRRSDSPVLVAKRKNDNLGFLRDLLGDKG